MEATRLISLHIDKGKTLVQTISDRTDYSKNVEKTGDGKYVSSYGCDSCTANDEILLARRQYGHTTGRSHRRNVAACQIRQSSKPGKVTLEETDKIGYGLAVGFTKGRWYLIWQLTALFQKTTPASIIRTMPITIRSL